jgi:SAM-dependent MidA family methyltransferase
MLQYIQDAIEKNSNKCITFADYMNLVLYHPQQGYYSSGKVNIGSEGDFFTASSLGSYFGELLAEQFIEIAENLDYLDSFTLVEVGAGSGVLAADILTYLEQKKPNLYQQINYIIVEESEGLIEKQKSFLKDFKQITWKSWQDITDNSIIGCIFSNELIDAFPVHQVIVKNQSLKEIYVTYLDNEIKEVIKEISTSKLLDYFQLIDIDLTTNDYPETIEPK